jgi:AraC family transcriptional activator of pobA
MGNTSILDIKQFDKFENQNDFYANIFSEHLVKHHHSISVPHKHNFYLVVLFTQGTGFHEIDFERFEVQRGSIFLLNPGQTHYWELSSDIEGFIFFHTESFYNFNFAQNTLSIYPFFYTTQNSPFLLLIEALTHHISMRFQDILLEYESEKLYKSRKIISLIDLLYIDLSRIYLDQNTGVVHKTNMYSEKLKQLESLIDLNFKSEKSPAKYASWMNMTAKHLNRIVQHSVGKTTSNMIMERVVLEAKRLLSNSTKSINEIAEELGFEEQAYFSRTFKKITGETPSEFKSRYSLK